LNSKAIQCIIPCIEGLLNDDHDKAVKRLLFVLALWHGLAKLRQHTDTTLGYLDDATRRVGAELRSFAVWSAEYETRETPKEVDARSRREIAQKKRLQQSSKSLAQQQTKKSSKKNAAVAKKSFSLSTPKMHLLGHYSAIFKLYGTSDSYSTQVVRCGSSPIAVPLLIFSERVRTSNRQNILPER
jgi:hypothetical protein